jgi:hypothetical protein
MLPNVASAAPYLDTMSPLTARIANDDTDASLALDDDPIARAPRSFARLQSIDRQLCVQNQMNESTQKMPRTIARARLG